MKLKLKWHPFSLLFIHFRRRFSIKIIKFFFKFATGKIIRYSVYIMSPSSFDFSPFPLTPWKHSTYQWPWHVRWHHLSCQTHPTSSGRRQSSWHLHCHSWCKVCERKRNSEQWRPGTSLYRSGNPVTMETNIKKLQSVNLWNKVLKSFCGFLVFYCCLCL